MPLPAPTNIAVIVMIQKESSTAIINSVTVDTITLFVLLLLMLLLLLLLLLEILGMINTPVCKFNVIGRKYVMY